MDRLSASVFILFFFALLWVPFTARAAVPGNPSPSLIQSQVEATVIHVDKYAVYVPNLIFYWDSKMSKQNLELLTKKAEKLRNKKAIIAYSATGDLAVDKRPMVVDIIPSDEQTKQVTVGASSGIESTLASPQKETTAQQPPEEEDPREDEEYVVYSSIPRRPYGDTTQWAGEEVSKPITRDDVIRFIGKCMRATSKKDMEGVLSCYADKVEYYTSGIVDRNHIKRDKGYYFTNWDKIASSLNGDVVLIVTDQQNTRIAKFESTFSVENRNRLIQGRAENIWKLKRINDELKIVSERQRILVRE